MSIAELHPMTVGNHHGHAGVIALSNGVKLSGKQRSMLELAAKVAETSEGTKHHGAVIVKSGRVLAMGVNKWRNRHVTHTDEYDPSMSVHAEIDALSRIANAVGATIYVARVNNSGEHMMSRPCQRCEKALDAAGIKRVIYTVNDAI